MNDATYVGAGMPCAQCGNPLTPGQPHKCGRVGNPYAPLADWKPGQDTFTAQAAGIWQEGFAAGRAAATPNPQPDPAVCNRCGAGKGLHAVGESCNQNCGGRVVVRPLPPASPDERLREAGDAALEAEVWFRCPDTAELWRFAQALPDPADGSDRVPPPEGRQNMVLTWHGPAEGEPWQAAFDNGIGQATMVVEKAREQGIDVHVYAVRVGPVDGEYQPQVDALAAADREAPKENHARLMEAAVRRATDAVCDFDPDAAAYRMRTEAWVRLALTVALRPPSASLSGQDETTKGRDDGCDPVQWVLDTLREREAVCRACGGSGHRNGSLRAADPFGTCPGCGGTGNVAAADRDNPDGER